VLDVALVAKTIESRSSDFLARSASFDEFATSADCERATCELADAEGILAVAASGGACLVCAARGVILSVRDPGWPGFAEPDAMLLLADES
jgi:hypothetical protein